jgi:tRNA(adenine34) deaminase
VSAWDTLAIPWQAALEQAWTAYLHGSLPIGAVIVRGEEVVARGRNRIGERHNLISMISGNSLAHAEMNALMQLPDDLEGSDAILYSTMEPCPMCAGAIRVAHVPTTIYAARDAWGGSSQMFQLHPYMTRENIRVQHAGIKTLEEISVVLLLQSYLEIGAGVSQLSKFETILPNAVQLARDVFKTRQLEQWRKARAEVREVVGGLAQRLGSRT